MRRFFSICLCIMVCCAGCAGNGQVEGIEGVAQVSAGESSIRPVAPPDPIQAESIEPEDTSEDDFLSKGRERYIHYMEIVQEGIKTSSAIYNAHLEDPTEILEVRNVYGFSEQGSIQTKFIDENGNTHRYFIESFGETGKGIQNYFSCGNDIFYLEQLRMSYTTHLFHGGLNTNVKTYDLSKYVFDGDELYILDDVLEICVPYTEERKPSTWQTVEERFETRGEPN